MFEGIPNQESAEALKERLLEALRNNGLEDPESRELLTFWVERKEQEVSSCDDSERPTVQTIFELERVDVYIAAGDQNGARETLAQAYLMAHREGLDDLMDKAESIATTLGIPDLHAEAQKFVE